MPIQKVAKRINLIPKKKVRLTGEQKRKIAASQEKKAVETYEKVHGKAGPYKMIVARVRRIRYEIGTQYTRYFRSKQEQIDAMRRYRDLQNKIATHPAAANKQFIDKNYGSAENYNEAILAFKQSVIRRS